MADVRSMFRTKELSSLGGGNHGLKRTLSAWDLTAIGIGSMVGVGIFVLPGVEAARHAGPAIMLSFLLAGFAMACSGLAYAELSTMMPVSGSAYTYSFVTLGELPAWLMGWNLLLEYLVGAALVAIGWSAYLVHLLKSFGLALPVSLTSAPVGNSDGFFNLPALIVVAAVMIVLVIGVRESARTTLVLVCIKLAAVLLFLATSVPHVATANWTPFMPFGLGGVLTAASVCFIAFGGMDALTTAAEETRDPQRDLPFGIIVSLLVVTVGYVSVAAVMTGVVPFPQLDVADPMTTVLAAAKQFRVAQLISLAALVGMASVLLGLLMAQPRILFTMANDGLVPAGLAAVHPRFGTPVRATLLSGLVVIAMATLLPINVVAELCSLGFLSASFLACLSVLVLRKRYPDHPRTFRMPLASLLAPAGMAACGLLIVMLPFQTLVRYVVWMVIGVAVYLVGRSCRAGRGSDARG